MDHATADRIFNTCGSSDVVKCFVRLPDSKRLTSILHVMNCWNSTTIKTNNNNNNDFIYRGNSVGVIQSSLRSSLQHSTYVHKDTKQQKNKIYKII